MTEHLPPLPEPVMAIPQNSISVHDLYTADQMNAHYLKGREDERTALAAQAEADRKDAERYRWLVSRPCDGDDEFYISAQDSKQANQDGWWALGGDMSKEQADAYLDAAMKEQA